MKNILFAASEALPFIKTGGLADVAGSLPKYYDRKEYDVRVVMPKYQCMKEHFCEQLERVAECQVQLNWRTQYCGVYRTEVDGITYYLLDNDYYFAGPKPYGDIYQDAEKFAFFSKAVLTILPIIDFCPDVIHCHDWQTGLLPVFLDAQYRQDEFYRYIRTVFTIHNLKFQGRWYIDAIRDVTGFPQSYFSMDKLESYGQANLLKGGVVFSDYVTTVSETYAKEIQSSDGGEGLDGLFRNRAQSMTGIVNGLDYSALDPKTDNRISFRLEDDIAAYKHANKQDLQQSLGLNVDENAFLIGIVSRLTDQKGLDLINYILDEVLADERIQIVVLGTGEERYENMFRFFAGKYQGRVSANIYYSDDLAQKIYASCDAFLMPSLFEPCGLSQLMSLRYGTVPLVRETGGLKDTVEPYNEFEHTGTGFSFHNYNAHEMIYMIRYACKIFYQYHDEWMDIVKRGMDMDFSWKASSEKYAQIYDALCADVEQWKEAERRQKEEQELAEQKRREEEMLLRIRMEKEEEERRAAEEKAKKEAEKIAAAEAEAEKTAQTEKKPAAKKTRTSASKTTAAKKTTATKAKTTAAKKTTATKAKTTEAKKTTAAKSKTAKKTTDSKKEQ